MLHVSRELLECFRAKRIEAFRDALLYKIRNAGLTTTGPNKDLRDRE